MDKLFARYAQLLQDWPRVLPDEPLAFSDADGQPPLSFEDWLSELRGNEAGARCRLVLETSGLVKDRRWRYARLLPHWVTHVAGQLEGKPLTTLVVSKAGAATLPPLAQEAALAWWRELLQAWREGMRRPLPFCVDSAAAWLRFAVPDKGEPARERAREEARKCHEAECGRDPYVARAFPDFDMFHGEEFERWAATLLAPLRDALGAPPKGEAE
jgi:exodeoxyribonuclease V gamma subunit